MDNPNWLIQNMTEYEALIEQGKNTSNFVFVDYQENRYSIAAVSECAKKMQELKIRLPIERMPPLKE